MEDLSVRPYFEKSEKDGHYIIVKFNYSNGDELHAHLSKILDHFYIEPSKLKELCSKNGTTRSKVMDTLLPDPGSVMSGDFAEILSYLFLRETYTPPLVGPVKWRWKEDRNKAVQKTDIVLFHLEGKKSKKKDFLVAVEVKAKATKDDRWAPIQKSIEGLSDDYLRRLAITLPWMRDRALRDDHQTMVNTLDRFINSQKESNGPYEKKFKAFAVIDENLVQDELEKEINTKGLELPSHGEIVVLSLPNLKELYEQVYRGAKVD